MADKLAVWLYGEWDAVEMAEVGGDRVRSRARAIEAMRRSGSARGFRVGRGDGDAG